MFRSYKGSTYANNRELALRQASAWGDIEMVKKLVELGADVHSKGEGTKRTALHQACFNGHTDIAIFLFEQGADPHVLDRELKTPIMLCKENKHDSIAKTFELFSAAKQASDIARQIFPIEANSLTSEQIQHRQAFRARVQLQYNQLMTDFRKAHNHVFQCVFNAPDIMNCEQYIGFLIDVGAYMSVALKEHYKIGSCGERTRAAFAYLANRFENVYDDTVLLEMYRIERGDSRNNHAFLVINRPINSDSSNPKTWDNAIVCDPLFGHVYMAKNAPPLSAVDEMRRATKVLNHSSMYQKLNPNTPPRITDFYKSYISQLVRSNSNTIQSILPTIIRTGTEEPMNESNASGVSPT